MDASQNTQKTVLKNERVTKLLRAHTENRDDENGKKTQKRKTEAMRK